MGRKYFVCSCLLYAVYITPPSMAVGWMDMDGWMGVLGLHAEEQEEEE